MKHNKDPGDDQYIIKDTELDYDAWEKDKKGPMPDTTIKPDTTPYKGKWVDVN